jgi:hypothetical protein
MSEKRQEAELRVRGPQEAELELAKARIMEAAHSALREIGAARVADGVGFGLGLDDFGLVFELSWDAVEREAVR